MSTSSLEIYRVRIVTTPPGLLEPKTTGLPAAIRAARAIVTRQADSRSHVVVWAASPGQLPDEELLWKLFPADIVTCVMSEAPGMASLSCSSAEHPRMFEAAAAATTIKRSWGWDDAASIAVAFSVGYTVVLDPVFDGQSWAVAVHRP